MNARSRITSRFRLHRRLYARCPSLAPVGIDWHSSRIPARLARFFTRCQAMPGSAKRCQEMPEKWYARGDSNP